MGRPCICACRLSSHLADRSSMICGIRCSQHRVWRRRKVQSTAIYIVLLEYCFRGYTSSPMSLPLPLVAASNGSRCVPPFSRLFGLMLCREVFHWIWSGGSIDLCSQLSKPGLRHAFLFLGWLAWLVTRISSHPTGLHGWYW